MTTVEPRTASTATQSAAAPDDDATRAFSLSVVISGIRCVLTYVVFPWILPIVGVARGVGPVIGLVVGTVALASNVASIRRFWRARHRWRWPITVVNLSVMGLLVILVVDDVRELLS